MATTGTSSPMRQIKPSIDPITGDITYTHQLTDKTQTDKVRLTMKPVYVLPVVFVPGIMGSNLKGTNGKHAGDPVWRLDDEGGMFTSHAGESAGTRQKALHPGRTEVDDRGELPKAPIAALQTTAQINARGWGEVGKTSYQEFLIWLEESLNGGGTAPKHAALNQTLAQVSDAAQWGARKKFTPLTPEESQKAEQWFYPVHACGYNWLDDNAKAADHLAERIATVMEVYNRKGICKQVILVTHSMGGLVARACNLLPGMEQKIAGIVHGVMPAVGAAVAYRRCKVGMMDEGASGLALVDMEHNKAVGKAWGAARVIGKSGKEVTAVFAQAPGALQLLPTKQYQSQWLKVVDTDGKELPDQPSTTDPYGVGGVYMEQKKWWGLIREEWLRPLGGQEITWTDYEKCLKKARDFHDDLKDNYHPNTWGFYGSRVDSFEQVRWTLTPVHGTAYKPKPRNDATQLSHTEVPLRGANPEYLPNKPVVYAPPGRPPMTLQSGSDFELRLNTANDSGDGTVPRASGAHPINPGHGPAVQQCVKQFFEVQGIEHEPAYKNLQSQHITAYAIAKIAAALPLPTKA